MASITSIAISDGKATPVTHTFQPIRSGENAEWRTADSSLPLVGQESLSTKYSRTKSGMNVVTMVLNLPALETATGANASGYTASPKVAYFHKVKVEFLLPERGTPAQRTDLRALLRSALANALVIDVVDNLAPPF